MNHVEQLAHRRRAADHAAYLEALRQDRIGVEHGVAIVELLAHRRHQRAHARHVERLGEVLGRAELDRLDRVLDGGATAHQRNLRARPGRPDTAQHFQPADTRHVQVEEHEIHVTAPQHFERRRSISGLEHFESFSKADLT